MDYDIHFGKVDDPELEDVLSYLKLIGKLLSLTITKSNSYFAFKVLNQFIHKPKKSHIDSTLTTVRYLKGSPGVGILLKNDVTIHVSLL